MSEKNDASSDIRSLVSDRISELAEKYGIDATESLQKINALEDEHLLKFAEQNQIFNSETEHPDLLNSIEHHQESVPTEPVQDLQLENMSSELPAEFHDTFAIESEYFEADHPDQSVLLEPMTNEEIGEQANHQHDPEDVSLDISVSHTVSSGEHDDNGEMPS